jgi:hypothetical protein
MKLPAGLTSGVPKAGSPKPETQDPFSNSPSIPAADRDGTNVLGMLAADRAAEHSALFAAQAEERKAIEAAEEARWQHILARRKLHGQMA